MLTVATCFWEANRHSAPSSRGYSPMWVDRLASAVRRNLTVPHRFVVLTDKPYAFAGGVQQERLARAEPDWSCMIEPFRIEGPLMVMGLDTLILRNIDHLAAWCDTPPPESPGQIAVPRSPGKPYACNAIALVPAGHTGIHARWRGENDMEWLRLQPHAFIDDLWPGHVASYKCSVRPKGIGEARIVYFHGSPKMADLIGQKWVRENWR